MLRMAKVAEFGRENSGWSSAGPSVILAIRDKAEAQSGAQQNKQRYLDVLPGNDL